MGQNIKSLAACVCVSVCARFWTANISKTVRDRGLATMACGGSIGHVTDDVTWPKKVKVANQIYKMPIISKMVGDIDSVTIEHL